jgi:TorA maturation chaperone TorD
MTMPLPDPALVAAAEARILRFLALCFERPRAGWLEELSDLAGEIAAPAPSEIAEQAHDADEGAYHALLGPGGTVSPREVGYRRLEDPGRILAELARVHEAFGFRPRSSEEPIDHLAVEIDFVAYLCLKQAFAIAGGDEQAAAVTREARRHFVDRHLGPVARAFARRLGGAGPDYLVHAAALLVECLPAGLELAEGVPAPGLGAEADPDGC